eukprot:gene14967-17697_t
MFELPDVRKNDDTVIGKLKGMLDLRFPRIQEERHFQSYYFHTYVKQVRIAILFLTALLTLALVVDYVRPLDNGMIPDYSSSLSPSEQSELQRNAFIIRLVTVGLLVAFFFFTFMSAFRRLWKLYTGIIAFIAACATLVFVFDIRTIPERMILLYIAITIASGLNLKLQTIRSGKVINQMLPTVVVQRLRLESSKEQSLASLVNLASSTSSKSSTDAAIDIALSSSPSASPTPSLHNSKNNLNNSSHSTQSQIDEANITPPNSRRTLVVDPQSPSSLQPGQYAAGNKLIVDNYNPVTVLFCEIVNFTAMLAKMPSVQVITLLNEIYNSFDRLTDVYGVTKVEHIGNVYMVVGGCPELCPDHAVRVAHMSLGMLQVIRRYGIVQVKMGIHSGPVVGGIIGKKKLSWHLFGDTINTSSRMASHSSIDRIQVSQPVQQLLRSQFLFEDRGKIQVKGKGPMRTFYLIKTKSLDKRYTSIFSLHREKPYIPPVDLSEVVSEHAPEAVAVPPTPVGPPSEITSRARKGSIFASVVPPKVLSFLHSESSTDLKKQASSNSLNTLTSTTTPTSPTSPAQSATSPDSIGRKKTHVGFVVNPPERRPSRATSIGDEDENPSDTSIEMAHLSDLGKGVKGSNVINSNSTLSTIESDLKKHYTLDYLRLKFVSRDNLVEREFRKDYTDRVHKKILVSMLFANVIFALGALLDYFLLKGSYEFTYDRSTGIRFGIVIFALIYVYIASKSDRLKRQLQFIGSFYFVVMAGMCIMMMSLTPLDGMPVEGLLVSSIIMLFTVCYNFSGIRFMASNIVCVFCVLLLELSFAWKETSRDTVLSHNLYIVAAILLNIAPCYLEELFMRQNWVHGKLLDKDKRETEALVSEILPATVVTQMKGGRQLIADEFEQVTIFLSDIVGFTEMAARLTPDELVETLNEVYSTFDEIAAKHGVLKVATIGDAYLCVCGCPEIRDDHAERVAAMAIEMIEAIKHVRTVDNIPIRMRIGIHTGPVVAGVVGIKMIHYQLWGESVQITQQMESSGRADMIHVSEDTQALLAHKYIFEDRGDNNLKRLTMKTFFLLRERTDDDPPIPTDPNRLSMTRGAFSLEEPSSIAMAASAVRSRSHSVYVSRMEPPEEEEVEIEPILEEDEEQLTDPDAEEEEEPVLQQQFEDIIGSQAECHEEPDVLVRPAVCDNGPKGKVILTTPTIAVQNYNLYSKIEVSPKPMTTVYSGGEMLLGVSNGSYSITFTEAEGSCVRTFEVATIELYPKTQPKCVYSVVDGAVTVPSMFSSYSVRSLSGLATPYGPSFTLQTGHNNVWANTTDLKKICHLTTYLAPASQSIPSVKLDHPSCGSSDGSIVVANAASYTSISLFIRETGENATATGAGSFSNLPASPYTLTLVSAACDTEILEGELISIIPTIEFDIQPSTGCNVEGRINVNVKVSGDPDATFSTDNGANFNPSPLALSPGTSPSIRYIKGACTVNRQITLPEAAVDLVYTISAQPTCLKPKATVTITSATALANLQVNGGDTAITEAGTFEVEYGNTYEIQDSCGGGQYTLKYPKILPIYSLDRSDDTCAASWRLQVTNAAAFDLIELYHSGDPNNTITPVNGVFANIEPGQWTLETHEAGCDQDLNTETLIEPEIDYLNEESLEFEYTVLMSPVCMRPGVIDITVNYKGFFLTSLKNAPFTANDLASVPIQVGSCDPIYFYPPLSLGAKPTVDISVTKQPSCLYAKDGLIKVASGDASIAIVYINNVAIPKTQDNTYPVAGGLQNVRVQFVGCGPNAIERTIDVPSNNTFKLNLKVTPQGIQDCNTASGAIQVLNSETFTSLTLDSQEADETKSWTGQSSILSHTLDFVTATCTGSFVVSIPTVNITFATTHLGNTCGKDANVLLHSYTDLQNYTVQANIMRDPLSNLEDPVFVDESQTFTNIFYDTPITSTLTSGYCSWSYTFKPIPPPNPQDFFSFSISKIPSCQDTPDGEISIINTYGANIKLDSATSTKWGMRLQGDKLVDFHYGQTDSLIAITFEVNWNNVCKGTYYKEFSMGNEVMSTLTVDAASIAAYDIVIISDQVASYQLDQNGQVRLPVNWNGYGLRYVNRASKCSLTETLSIYYDTEIKSDISSIVIRNETCIGSQDASITVPQPTSTARYLLSDGDQADFSSGPDALAYYPTGPSNSYTGLASKTTYVITKINPTNLYCFEKRFLMLGEIEATVSSSLSGDTCSANSSPSLTASVSGGFTNVTYIIDGTVSQRNNGVFPDLQPGQHSLQVLINDAKCQRYLPQTKFIIDGSLITATADVSACETLVVTATSDNQTAIVTVTLDNGSDQPFTQILSTGKHTFTSLAPGSYTAKFTDGTGCKVTKQAVITDCDLSSSTTLSSSIIVVIMISFILSNTISPKAQFTLDIAEHIGFEYNSIDIPNGLAFATYCYGATGLIVFDLNNQTLEKIPFTGTSCSLYTAGAYDNINQIYYLIGGVFEISQSTLNFGLYSLVTKDISYVEIDYKHDEWTNLQQVFVYESVVYVCIFQFTFTEVIAIDFNNKTTKSILKVKSNNPTGQYAFNSDGYIVGFIEEDNTTLYTIDLNTMGITQNTVPDVSPLIQSFFDTNLFCAQ